MPSTVEYQEIIIQQQLKVKSADPWTSHSIESHIKTQLQNCRAISFYLVR
jgi:hypothetical protein